MHTFGWIGSLSLLLTVICSSAVNRHLTWMNLNFSWIIACFAAALLLTSGQLFKDTPNSSICLIQSSTMLAVPSLTAGTTLSFLWIEIKCRAQDRKAATSFQWDAALALMPFIFPFVFLVIGFTNGYQNPSSVILAPSKMACINTNMPTASQVTIAYCTALMVPTVVLSFLVNLEVYRHWKETLAKMIRLAVFMFFSLIAVVINVIVASGANFGTAYGVPNILVSLAPVSYVLVFATQKDIISAWMFWRRRNHAQPLEKSPTIEIV
ncbi:hypothetical protein BDZ89DRAFT_1130655 [Hymenopellis radicata]|nr:hypothetical protein BDZ89DRAFT_1130655 [Hymenopellis radicata]